MSVLKSITRVQVDDGVKFLCEFETDFGVIPKSVAVSSEFIAGTNRAGVRDNVLNQIVNRAKECERHINNWNELSPRGNGRPANNPKHLWQHKENPKLFDSVKRGDVERLVNEALNA